MLYCPSLPGLVLLAYLSGKKLVGWRGEVAAKWTIFAFIYPYSGLFWHPICQRSGFK